MVTTAKAPIPEKTPKEIELVFMHKILQEIEKKYEILHSLIINSNQTPYKYGLVARYKLAEKRSKSVIVAGGANKQAITATFVQTLNSKVLPMQLMNQVKTSQSFPKIEILSSFSLSANETHFSNTQESIRFLEEIEVPYEKKEEGRVGPSIPNSAISLNAFRGQKSLNLHSKFWRRITFLLNIYHEYIPSNMANYYWSGMIWT